MMTQSFKKGLSFTLKLYKGDKITEEEMFTIVEAMMESNGVMTQNFKKSMSITTKLFKEEKIGEDELFTIVEAMMEKPCPNTISIPYTPSPITVSPFTTPTTDPLRPPYEPYCTSNTAQPDYDVETKTNE